MLALVKAGPGPGLELCDVPRPRFGINDVRIRVLRTGICGTDLHIYAWDGWAERNVHPPLVVGHEFVGIIEEVGSNVTGFAPATWCRARGTWCAGGAATAWPDGGSCVPTPSVWAWGATAPSPSTSCCP